MDINLPSIDSWKRKKKKSFKIDPNLIFQKSKKQKRNWNKMQTFSRKKEKFVTLEKMKFLTDKKKQPSQ